MGIELSDDVTVEVPGYPGTEVLLAVPASFEEFLIMRGLGRVAQFDGDALEEVRDALIQFGDTFLRAWNVDRRGAAVPASGAGLASLPVTFQLGLLSAWLKAVTGGPMAIPDPLAEPSPNGEQSPAQLVTTAAS